MLFWQFGLDSCRGSRSDRDSMEGPDQLRARRCDMKWFISRGDKVRGPFDEGDVLAAIENGQIVRGDKVCREGTKDWIAVERAGEFAAALVPERTDGASPAPVRERRASPWPLRLAVVALVAGVAASGFACWVLWDLRDRSVAILLELENSKRTTADAVRELRTLTSAPKWEDESSVPNNCYANNSDISCTFTNNRAYPVATCVQGTLSPNDASGVRLVSLPMCTGKLMPAETRTVSAPWVGGFAKDLCYRENAYGKTLDWAKCKFSSDAVNLSAAVTAEVAVAGP
jgi:hypothetical protein